MSFWSTLFKSEERPVLPYPPSHFGRYSDYKNTAQRNAWERSRIAFEQQRYVASFREFMFYLADEGQRYVQYEGTDTEITFSIQQGSRRIKGHANAEEFKAEARIALAETLHVGFLRRLLEQNFHFEYCRYALTDEQEICVIFSTFATDASPYKLFYALKELAVHADKQDDLLLEEFTGLSLTHQSEIVAIPDAVKAVKYAYLQSEVNRVLAFIDNSTLDTDRYSKGFSFLLLHTAFKLDYLLRSEGYSMEAVERINRMYFASDQKSIAQKNIDISRELKKMAARSESAFYREQYLVGHTFGITVPENHPRFASLIEAEINQFDWYAQHGHTEIALAVSGYLVSYSLFSFALPRPVKDFLELYICIFDAQYFRDLGYDVVYIDANGQLVAKEIIRAIKQVFEYAKADHPHMKFDAASIQFDTKITFARSFLKMLQGINLAKIP